MSELRQKAPPEALHSCWSWPRHASAATQMEGHAPAGEGAPEMPSTSISTCHATRQHSSAAADAQHAAAAVLWQELRAQMMHR
jgi:hypothetical protein